MNEDEFNKFEIWIEGQPRRVTYKRAVSFLEGLLGVDKSEAEYRVSQLAVDGDIKIVPDKGKDYIFIEPLDELTEGDIRQAWDGSKNVEMDLEHIILTVQKRTGHDPEDIKRFLHNLETAKVDGGMFQWRQ